MQSAPPAVPGYGGAGGYPLNNNYGAPMPPQQQQQQQQQQGPSSKQVFSPSQGQGDQLASHMGNLQVTTKHDLRYLICFIYINISLHSLVGLIFFIASAAFPIMTQTQSSFLCERHLTFTIR